MFAECKTYIYIWEKPLLRQQELQQYGRNLQVAQPFR